MSTSILLSSLFLGQFVMADANENAQIKTQQLLNNKSDRDKASSVSAQGAASKLAVEQLTGGNAQMTDDVYKLASEVFANVVKDCNGDAKKMQEAMAKFQKDPHSFVETWTPEQKQKLTELSKKLEAHPAKP